MPSKVGALAKTHPSSLPQDELSDGCVPVDHARHAVSHPSCHFRSLLDHIFKKFHRHCQKSSFKSEGGVLSTPGRAERPHCVLKYRSCLRRETGSVSVTQGSRGLEEVTLQEGTSGPP